MIQQTPTATYNSLDLSTAQKVATLQSSSSDPIRVFAVITISGLNAGGRIQVTEKQLTTPAVTVTSFTKDMDGETTLSFSVSRDLAAGASNVEVYVEDLLNLSTTAKVVVDVFVDAGASAIIVLDATSQLLMDWYKVDLMQLTTGETRVPGAVLTVTSNADGTGLKSQVTVDSNGIGVCFLKAGNYYRWGQHRTFKFTNPRAFTIPLP